MAKVVGLSGAQGGGKSSLLVELQTRGWALDQFRVSRAVQAQLGWKSLDHVLTSPQVMVEFQEAVFKQKYEHDHALRQGQLGEVFLTERTFADICAYTTYWTWELHYQGKWLLTEAGEFLRGYVAKCMQAQEACYDGVLLLPYMPDQVQWVDDPNRADRRSVDQIYEGVERFTQSGRFIAQKKLTITAKTINDRADQVETFLRTI